MSKAATAKGLLGSWRSKRPKTGFSSTSAIILTPSYVLLKSSPERSVKLNNIQALASMSSEDKKPVCVMSRSNGHGSIAQGGRATRYKR